MSRKNRGSFSRRHRHTGPDKRSLKVKSLALRAYRYSYNTWTGSQTATLQTQQTDIVDGLGGLIQGDSKHKHPNPWKYRVRLSTWSRGETIRTFVTGGKEYTERTWGCLSQPVPEASAIPAPFKVQAHYDAALSRFYDKIRGGLDMGVAMGEAGTTARMARNRAGANNFFGATTKAANGLINLASGIAGRKIRVVKQLVGKTADYYLEWKYGWKPLLQDIYDASEEAIRIGSDGLEKFRATYYQPLDNVKITTTLNGGIFDHWLERVGKQGVTIRGVYFVPAVEETQQRWTGYNPAGLAWELIPFSFVVDWFYNVGNYLRDMESAFFYQSRFREGFVSYFSFCDAFYTLNQGTTNVQSGQPPTKNCVAYDVRASLIYRQAERVVMSSTPTPISPKCEIDLGSGDLLTLAGLMAQQWKKFM